MNIDNNITKFINDSLKTNSNFEFIAELKDLTLSDIDQIEKILIINKNCKLELSYQIVDNIYIRISYLM